eukprot:m.282471 g.282471  ORF g.282471 m.282471 type:complete len:345 (-) comp11111_c0_seq19:1221-2255(-)
MRGAHNSPSVSPACIVEADEAADGWRVVDTRRNRRSPPMTYRDAHEVALLRSRAIHLEDTAKQSGRGAWGVARRLRRHAHTIALRAVAPPAGHLYAVTSLLARLGRNTLHKEVAPEDVAALAASRLAYEDDVKRAEHPLLGRYYRPELSSEEVAVFDPHREGQMPLVAHRGSKTAEDWLRTDFDVATGGLPGSKRFKRASQQTEAARRAYGADQALHHVGHSLGGALASALAHQNETFAPGERYTTFNPGQGLGAGHWGKNGRVYSVDGDLVSALAHLKAPTGVEVRRLEGTGDSVTAHLLSAFGTAFADSAFGAEAPQAEAPQAEAAQTEAESAEAAGAEAGG